MPQHQICSIPGCSSRSDRQEFECMKFHRIPQDPDLRHDWLVSIKKPITVSENSRTCSLHFEGSEKTADCPLPSIFPWSVSVKHRQPPAICNPLPLKKQKHEKPLTPTQVKLDVARREIERHEERIVQLQANVLRLEEEVKISSTQRS